MQDTETVESVTQTQTHTFRHLVISGGGPMGFRFLGALEELENQQVWHLDQIESIFGTSIGALIGAFLCLSASNGSVDWDTLNCYLLERPWHEAFRVTGRQIVDSFVHKGLFGIHAIEIILRPLLETHDLPLQVTLQQLFDFSHIDLHVCAFDVNGFETVNLSHESHGDLPVVQALAMSMALPGLFQPVFYKQQCFIDGGVMCNFPVNYCLAQYPDPEAILGISISSVCNSSNTPVVPESSLLEYIVALSLNAMNYIHHSVPIQSIPHMIWCPTEVNPMTLEAMQPVLQSAEVRRQWRQRGIEDARTRLWYVHTT